VLADCHRSPLDPAVSQFDWGGDFDQDGAEGLDPLSSMMGDLDLDQQASGTSSTGGLGVYLGPRKLLGPGELFGEISFFTEIPQMETVRYALLCKGARALTVLLSRAGEGRGGRDC
jgi:hypothetical protein